MVRINYKKHIDELVSKKDYLADHEVLTIFIDLKDNTYEIYNHNYELRAKGGAKSLHACKIQVKENLKALGVKFDIEKRVDSIRS